MPKPPSKPKPPPKPQIKKAIGVVHGQAYGVANAWAPQLGAGVARGSGWSWMGGVTAWQWAQLSLAASVGWARALALSPSVGDGDSLASAGSHPAGVQSASGEEN